MGDAPRPHEPDPLSAENRKMTFKEALVGWIQGQRTQAEAALLLGRCVRSFRRHIERFEADGLDVPVKVLT